MSGGDKKKRSGGGGGTRTGFGWEEAGAEFYQECYPGTELDLEALPRDPHYFATLLPSKQNRATTKRPKAESKSTFKRRTSTRSRRYSTMGQNTVQTDIHVSMMPDLSENLANEESTWDEIMLIKAMPVSMSQKKEMKAKLLSAETFRLQGLKQFKWQRRKLWEYLKMRRKEVCESLRLWQRCIRNVEGNAGVGVAAYFLFVKWLLFLNLVTSAVSVIFVIVPAVTFVDGAAPVCGDNSSCCLETRDNMSLSFVELLQGDGWLESTAFYYGGVYIPGGYPDYGYNLPVAYLCAALLCFGLCLGGALRKASVGFRQKLLDSQGQYYKYCNSIFSGWDFGIYNEKSAAARQRALYYVMRSSLDSERRAEERRNQSREESCRLASVRILVNVFVLLILAASSSLVYFVFAFCRDELAQFSDDIWYTLTMEFVPAVCIAFLNRAVPGVFGYVVPFERYSMTCSKRTTLCRNVALRTALFSVLLWSVYSSADYCCWETYIGKQLYKVLLSDVTLEALLTFFVDFPRMLIGRQIRALGPRNFDLPRHSLDLAYIQTLVTFCTYYVPFLPVLGVILFFLLFYIKKFICLINCGPPTRLYSSAETEALVSTLLSFCIFMAIIPWAYAFSQMKPSTACGPLTGLDSAWTLVQNVYLGLPPWLKSCLDQLTTASCIIPLFAVLLVTLYYFYVIYRANSQMVTVLKKQLILEGHDKQFLLNRLSAFIKQHQERHKASRSVDHQTPNG